MKIQWSKIRWGKAILFGILAPIISVILVILTIFIYGLVLGFQARAMPDITRINQFAQNFAPWAAPLLSILLTIGGATLVARKTPSAPYENGIFTGLVASVFGLGISLISTSAFHWEDIIIFLLALGAGFLGGFLATLGRPKSLIAAK